MMNSLSIIAQYGRRTAVQYIKACNRVHIICITEDKAFSV